MERKKMKGPQQQLNEARSNGTPKRNNPRKRSIINYAESESEDENTPKKSLVSKQLEKSDKTSNNKTAEVQKLKRVCENASKNDDQTPKKKARQSESSINKKRATKSKTKNNDDSDDDFSEDEYEDKDLDYECSTGSENDEWEENDKIVSKNLIIDENAFKEELENIASKSDNVLKKEIEVLKYNDDDDDKKDIAALLNILKGKMPDLLNVVVDLLKKVNKMHLFKLNNGSSTYGASVFKVFAFCVIKFKNDYNYESFFENEKFDLLISSYFKYQAFDRKLRGIAKAGVSLDGKVVLTKELNLKTITSNLAVLFNWIRMFDCKISKETKELFKNIPYDDIKSRRGLEDTEVLKWPLTLFDLNWYLEHHSITDEKGLMAAALICFMTYTGVRHSTLKEILLKDMMVHQHGRKVSQISFALTWLKETSETKKMFIPGDVKPIDVAGLLILYLDKRNVFEAGLDESTPSFLIKSDCQNEPLFVFSHTRTEKVEVSEIYKELAERLDAPKFAISPRSSRKGHCIEHLLNTKTVYPAMPLELLEEDLISMGTWRSKTGMRHYLKGGCDQVLVTCSRIDNLETPAPSFDAKECHLFLVDALQITSDWKTSENDASVKEMEMKMIEYGASKQMNKKNKMTLSQYCQKIVSSINFYKKVKALELDLNQLPKIAISILPKSANLEHGYREGEDVFLKSSPICETCKSICIREKPAIEYFNAFSFKADKTFYQNYKGLDDNEFENKMAEQFTNDANQQKCLLKLFQDWSLEK